MLSFNVALAVIKPAAWVVAFILISTPVDAQPSRSIPDGIWVRDGFELSVVQSDLQKPRFMQCGPDRTLYVSLPMDGQIKSCRDTDNDGYYETVATFVSDQPAVHCMWWHDDALYFARTDAVLRSEDNDADGVADQTVVILKDLPGRGTHWQRTVMILNDRLYTSIGDSGNVNVEDDTDRQKIFSYALDGSDKKLFCSGLRNTEKLVVRPGTDEIWGMDHGSDWFGGMLESKRLRRRFGQPITDYNPPCEMNHYIEGGFYGHPFVVGNRIPRLEYLNRKDIVEIASRTIVPRWCTAAHASPNAMVFYTGNQFPRELTGDAFVAFHGSWNRNEKIGYCVSRVLFEQGNPYGELIYASFISPDGEILGRPVDVVIDPDGALLISDDSGNRIYRMSYTGTGTR